MQLPKTDFPMKANLAQNEPKRIQFWKDKGIYQKMVAARKGGERFTMPDGPPYANGKLHVGHVLNKVLKDITVKYRNLSGRPSAFIPGWDCHGLPIELNVTKKLAKEKRTAEAKEIRDLCRKEALHWKQIQQDQFIRLGVLADWENPYLTLQPEYEADEIRVLAQCLENGIVYRGEKPVYWDIALQTATAAAEVEYKNHKSPSIYVKFDLNEPEKLGLKKETAIVIWTTTPWTLPANLGIALHPEFDYGVFDSSQGSLIIAKDLKESVEKACSLELSLIKTFKGAELEGLTAKHPFIHRDSKIIMGDHVTLESGTGAVHTAPGHGMEDYIVGQKYDLGVLSPVDEYGKYNDLYPEMKGVKIWDANPKIVENLKNSGHLIGYSEIEHSYPHHPRSKKPLIFRATPQWFIRLNDKNFNVREKALRLAESSIQYVPAWGKQRFLSTISSSPDWCISRQRIWGVPIPAYKCKSCGDVQLSAPVMRRLADKMEESGEGLETYHDTDPKEFLLDSRCSQCGGNEFETTKDILDVWFDSGICHTAVQKRRPELDFPADIYLEGSDQHRGWFQTSLISSVAATGEAPFKRLLTHGFVTDAQGYKMSKSLGNVVDPEEIIKESGAEILRLWAAHEDYGDDLSISREHIKRITEAYRRFRNTFRFMLGNLYDFVPKKDSLPLEKLSAIDRWALHRLQALIEKVSKAYESYEYYKVFHAVNQFFTVDLSATYLDILKDRLYTSKANGDLRRGSQTVIYEVTKSLASLMAPVTCFLSEEVFEHLPQKEAESVFLTSFPKGSPQWKNDPLHEDFEFLLDVRSQAQKLIEEMRRNKEIGASLEASLDIVAPKDSFKILSRYEKDLKEFFIVSGLNLNEGDAFRLNVRRAEGIKCERCWHIDPKTNENPMYPGLCPKCIAALQ